LFRQLSTSEGRLLAVLEKAKRERAKLNGRSVMNASAGEARAARFLSNVLDARRRLEEDAEEALLRPGDTVSRAAATADGLSVSGLRERLEEAVAVAEASQEHLSSLSGVDDNDDAFQVVETRDCGGVDGSGNAAPLSIYAPFADGTAVSASATAAVATAAAAPAPAAPAPAAATAVGVRATAAAATNDDDDGDAAGLTPSLSATGTTASRTNDDQGGVGSNGDDTINGNAGLNGFGTIVLERQSPPQQRSDKQQRQQRSTEPVAPKFSQGPTYDGVDYRPGASAPRYGRVPPEETFPRAEGEEERRGGREEQDKQPQWRRQQQQSVSQQQQQQQQQQQEYLRDLLHQHQHQRKTNIGAPQPKPPPRQENDDAYDPCETLRMFGSTSLSPAAATPAPGNSGAAISNKPTPYGNNGRSWVPDRVEAAVDDDGGGGGGVAASESGGGGSGGREQRSRDGSWAATEPPKEKTRRSAL
ncbi:unnamed protein product, partial [Ectocarpus sp. 13 AM-2016]